MLATQSHPASVWGKYSLATRRMWSPGERWNTTKLVLKAIAALVAAVAITCFARWMILDSHAKLASGNWLVSNNNGISFHPYGRWEVGKNYFSGIVCALLGWGVVYSTFSSLIKKIKSIANQHNHLLMDSQ